MPRRRQSRFSASEPTIDVETAVTRLIARIMEAGDENTTPEQIRTQISRVIQNLSRGSTSEESATRVPAGSIPVTLTLDPATSEFFNRPFSLPVLKNEIMPFIHALLTVQKLLDEILERPQTGMGIIKIDQGPPLTITLAGAARAAASTEKFVNPWRIKNPDKIGIESEGEAQGSTLERQKIEIAKSILKDHAPTLLEQEVFSYFPRLLPVLSTLMYSKLHINNFEVFQPGEANA